MLRSKERREDEEEEKGGDVRTTKSLRNVGIHFLQRGRVRVKEIDTEIKIKGERQR